MVKLKYLIVPLLIGLPGRLFSQPDTLTLDYCYERARELSPLQKQELLHEKMHELGLEKHQTNYLPNISVNGRASYQSEVITFPGTAMIPDFPVIPKEQFQVSLDINQPIYDGGATRQAKRIEDSQYEVNQAQLESELYRIRSNINQLYFSVLQLQEMTGIMKTTLATLRSQRERIEASVKNGVLLENNLHQIDKKILSLEQEIIETGSNRLAVIQMLSMWIGEEIRTDTEFLSPHPPEQIRDLPVERPENALFQAQRALLESRMSMSAVERLPKFSAFAQGGLGQPNPVNFFEVDPSSFYIIGLRLQWSVLDWGRVSKEKQILGLHQEVLNSREADFNRNIRMSMSHQQTEIDKLEELLQKDRQIISLQQKIVKTAFSELQHGVITSTEYLTEVNALAEAEIKKALHEVRLSKAYVETYTSSGHEF